MFESSSPVVLPCRGVVDWNVALPSEIVTFKNTLHKIITFPFLPLPLLCPFNVNLKIKYVPCQQLYIITAVHTHTHIHSHGLSGITDVLLLRTTNHKRALK